MKQAGFYEGGARPRNLRGWWISLLVGLPMTTALLLVTQLDLRGMDFLSIRMFNKLETPYRYRFNESLGHMNSPIAQVEQEIAFYQGQVHQEPQSALNQASLATAYLKMARVTGEANWYLLADQSARQSLTMLPFHNTEAVVAMVRVAEARHDFRGALQLIQPIAGQREAIATQVTANLAMGNLKAANQAADQLAEQGPSISSLTLQAMVKAAQGRDQEALQSFQEALDTEEAAEVSSSARTRTLLGRFYYERGQLELAGELYREALRILPGYSLALIDLAQLEIRQGHYRSADRHYAQVAATSRGTPRVFDPTILRGRARIKELQGDTAGAEALWSQAETMLRQFVSASATSAPSASTNGLAGTNSFGHGRELARLLLERGRPEDVAEALSLMRLQVSIRRDTDTLSVYTWALSRAGRWQEAQQAVQEAIAQGVHDASIFYRAGTVEHALGNESQATQYFRRAQEIDPQFGDRARQALGLGVGLGS